MANYCTNLANVQVYAVITYVDEKAYKLNDNIIIYTLPYSAISISKIFKRQFYINKIIKKINPDVIVSIPRSPSVYIALSKIISHGEYRTIFSERSDPACRYTTKIKEIFWNFVFGMADVIVFQTKEAEDYFPDYIKKKGRIILNPITDDLPMHSVSSENNDIITFCRVEKVKNLPMLFNAFLIVHKSYPDLKLRIWGEGSQMDCLNNLIKELGMKEYIFMEGYSDNIHKSIKNSMMYVNSSDHEGLSNSMLEAMCMGLPVICTDCPVGGARLIIKDHENGLLVPVNDENKMASAIIELVEDRNLRVKLSENAKKIKEEIGYESIMKQWVEVIYE